MCITVRYGARTLEVVEGKNAIETENIAGAYSNDVDQPVQQRDQPVQLY
jgi:hypothetical protein